MLSRTHHTSRICRHFSGDIKRGDVIMEDGKSLRNYITEYQLKNRINSDCSIALGLTEAPKEANINEYDYLDALKTID